MLSKLFVGSKNPVKVNAAHITLSITLEQDFDVYEVGVPSGVSEQPMSEEETRLGAVNRVKALIDMHKDDTNDSWYVAIEGGVDVFEDGPATFAYVAIYNGGRMSIGRSANLPLQVTKKKKKKKKKKK